MIVPVYYVLPDDNVSDELVGSLSVTKQSSQRDRLRTDHLFETLTSAEGLEFLNSLVDQEIVLCGDMDYDMDLTLSSRGLNIRTGESYQEVSCLFAIVSVGIHGGKFPKNHAVESWLRWLKKTQNSTNRALRMLKYSSGAFLLLAFYMQQSIGLSFAINFYIIRK